LHFLEFLPGIQAGLDGQPHVQHPDVQDGIRGAPDCVIKVFVVDVLLLVLFRPKRQWSAWFHPEQKRESTKQDEATIANNIISKRWLKVS
jgi:hypothetical protein